eukprot:519281-Alexandrium_andersonii.AAC.1
MAKELEKTQKQRARAEEELERLQAREKEADARHQKAKAAKALALGDLNSAEALDTPPGLPAAQVPPAQAGKAAGPGGFLAAAWELAVATGAPKGDFAKYTQETTASGETPLTEAAWKAQAIVALVSQLAAGDNLSSASASQAAAPA